MPEEKKENKAAAKDSFTFSDKIKNSKPAASKSFANRISSKIGSDGKPKKTLFERTKRDAPFFIAAIVALLLLPFLYKYSGSVDEDPTMVTPATEDTLFDPNRSGFDGIGDPEGQIAQLSGRDSMDLIVGFGNKKEEVSEELPYRNDLERSGLDEDYSSSNTAKEYNEKNVYRYKKQAAPATKAAFKKTNINPLRGAGLTSRGGGKLGVGMWGGGLKQAANKVKADGLKSSPKPVSLQPLQAAGKPSRSYFGQGAAAEARRSKDAMSKANAMQALMDAQMKPIEPGKIGGIGGGDFGGPGGGNGNLDRKFAFNGKEPWWWDMMKKRSQMEWEAKFNRKWDWIKWGDKLAQTILGGILNCLITGDEDGAPGKLFGAKAGAGEADECGGLDKSQWEKVHSTVPFGKDFCREFYKAQGIDVKKDDPWKAGKGSAVDLNFFQVRWDCLSNGAFDARKQGKAREGIVTEQTECTNFYGQGKYLASVGGNYSLYHYVVGVDRADWPKYIEPGADSERRRLAKIIYLWDGGGFSINPNEPTQWMNKRDAVPLFIESVAIKNKKVKKDSGKIEDSDEIKEIKNKATKGLKYDTFLEILRKGGMMYDIESDDSTALSLSVKGGKQGAGKDWVTGARCAYPLAFASCHNEAILQNTTESGEEINGVPAAFAVFPNVGQVKDNKNFYQEVQKLFFITYKLDNRLNSESGTVGYYANTYPSKQDYAPNAKLTGVSGLALSTDTIKYNVTPVPNSKGAQAINGLMGQKEASATVTWEVRQCWDPLNPWSYARDMQDGACGRAMDKMNGVKASELPGQIVSTATCVYGDEGPVSGGVEENECPQGKDTSEECCKKLGGDNHEWDGKQCKLKDTAECPQGKHTNAECCAKLGDSTDVWQNGKCAPLPPVNECPNGKDTNEACCLKLGKGQYHWKDGQCVFNGMVHLAPVIEWVPSDISARLPVVSGQNPTAQHFTGGQAIPTKNDSQHCGAEMGRIMIESTAATTFSNNVVDAYNAKYSEKPMAKVSASYPTMGEFVDALYVANQLGITDVPKDAVCMLGQAMAQVSRDKHAGSLTWGDNRPFFNELGSYLAYVHPEAAYYPAKYYETATNCDKRFLAVAEAGCPATILVPGVKGHREFHHGNYAWNSNTSKYLASLTPGMKQYPLRALAEGVSFSAAGCTKGCGPKRKEYNRTFKFLLRGQCPQGNMQVADALKYVTAVCSTGLDYKPQGSPGNASGPSSDNSGSSGNNNSVRGK